MKLTADRLYAAATFPGLTAVGATLGGILHNGVVAEAEFPDRAPVRLRPPGLRRRLPDDPRHAAPARRTTHLRRGGGASTVR